MSNLAFRYNLGLDVVGGDTVEFTLVTGMRHIVNIPTSYQPGMTVDSDIQIRSHRVVGRPVAAERIEEDAEDVDFNYDEGLAGT